MRRAIVAVSLVMVVLSAACVLGAGELLTRPALRSNGEPPDDLEAVRITFASRSGAIVHGWLTNAGPGASAVLLLHPVRSNRSEMLGRARFLRRLGYAVLLIDLQAHGETVGERITFGWKESDDVAAAATFLRERFPNSKIGVIGVSLGGAALLLANPAPKVEAVVLEAVYPDIDTAVRNRLRLHAGTWAESLSGLLLLQLSLRLGISSDQLRPIDRAGELGAPALVVSGMLDQHTTVQDARRLFAALRAPKELWLVEGAGHVNLHQFSPTLYEARIGAFLARYLERKG
jgi:fermentation-respiration switch protein FrsA (DUF1100 family)